MANSLQTKQLYTLDKPKQMVEVANIIKNHIVKNKLFVNIIGKTYVMVEGWQFAGGMLGLFPRIVKVENIAIGKWLAQAEIINPKDGKVMGTGYAICSKEENKKQSFDEYAILSMAQTRAIGKAFRNLIGWVIKMAGYESTPAEEMSGKTIPLTKNGNGEGNKETKPQIGKIEELKSMLKGTSNGEKLVDLKKRLGIVLEDWNITEKHASGIIMQLLNKETKK